MTERAIEWPGWAIGTAWLAVMSGAALRIYRFGAVPIGFSGAELEILSRAAEWLPPTAGSVPPPQLLPVLHGLAISFFQVNAQWGRWLPALAALLATAAVTWAAAQRFGRGPALVGAAVALSDPAALHWSRFCNGGIVAAAAGAAALALATGEPERWPRTRMAIAGALTGTLALAAPSAVVGFAAAACCLGPLRIAARHLSNWLFWISGAAVTLCVAAVAAWPFSPFAPAAMIADAPPAELFLPEPLVRLTPEHGLSRPWLFWAMLAVCAFLALASGRGRWRSASPGIMLLAAVSAICPLWPAGGGWLDPSIAWASLLAVAMALSAAQRARLRPVARAAAVAAIAAAIAANSWTCVRALDSEWFRGESVAAHEFGQVIRLLPPQLPVWHAFPGFSQMAAIAVLDRKLVTGTMIAAQAPVLPTTSGDIIRRVSAGDPEFWPAALLVPPDTARALLQEQREADGLMLWEAPYSGESLQPQPPTFLVLLTEGWLEENTGAAARPE